MVERHHKSIGELHLKISLQPHERTKVLPHEAKRCADHHGGATSSEGGTLSVLQLSNESRVYVFPPFFTLTVASWLSRGVSGHRFK
jgi:hypothetical protein